MLNSDFVFILECVLFDGINLVLCLGCQEIFENYVNCFVQSQGQMEYKFFCGFVWRGFLCDDVWFCVIGVCFDFG